MGDDDQSTIKIAVLGVCASGKTTLVNNLSSMGYHAFVVSQEHSLVRRMWKLKNPDFVVVLDCSYETAKKRRPDITWGPQRLADERERLKDARENCDLYINTDNLGIEEVLEVVLSSIRKRFGGKSIKTSGGKEGKAHETGTSTNSTNDVSESG